MTDREEAIALADAWLASLGVTLWGDWYIDDPKRRRLAAEWFVDQYASLVAFGESEFGL